MAYTKQKETKRSRGELIDMASGSNPLDGYNQTWGQVNKDTQAKRNGTGAQEPRRGRSIADVQTGEVTDLEPEGYRSGALMARAKAIAAAMAVAATMEVQLGGEEGLEPQTA